MLAHLEIIDLPLPEKRILQRQYLETNIGIDAFYSSNFSESLPKAGGITWLIGTDLNSIPDGLMRMSIYCAFKHRPQELHYIDFANNSKGRSVYRYERILEKYSDPNGVHHRASQAGKKLLDSNLAAWSKFAEQWKKVTKKVCYFKKPNHKIKQDNILMLCLNPRLGVLHEIEQKTTASNRTVIADMDCSTIFDIGSRTHFGLNDSARSVQTIRSLLIKTDKVLEQRVVYLATYEKPIGLLREVAFDHEIHASLLDESIGLREVMTKAHLALPSWQEVASSVARKLSFSNDQVEELMGKATRLDAHSTKNAMQVMTQSNSEAERYVQAVQSYFADGHEGEVLELYQHLYGEKESGRTESEYVAACAKKDFHENRKTLNFGFPEFAIVNKSHNADSPLMGG